VTGRLKSLKNSSDTIGNETRDLPACGAMPQCKIRYSQAVLTIDYMQYELLIESLNKPSDPP
jgi:hypothetical protein